MRRRNPILPPRLEPGDAVGIISPSAPVDSREDLEKGLEALRSFGLVPRIAKNALRIHGNYMAGTREERLHDFHEMFADPEIKAIFCTGGGYSCNQLLPDINWELIRRNPKILMGYSDITTILLAIWKKVNMVTFHGPAIEGLDAQDPTDKFTLEHFRNILMEGMLGGLPHASEWKVLRPGCVQGKLLGGNLNILTGFLSNIYEPKWDGAILFWEEVDETVEGLDHYLWRLRVNGVFKKIRGMVIGKITDLQPLIEDEERVRYGDPPSVEEVIMSATHGYDFPILYGVDFGHEVSNIVFPMGGKVLLDCPRGGRMGNISILKKYLGEKK